jgi:conjugative element/phage-associated large polyvalent protein
MSPEEAEIERPALKSATVAAAAVNEVERAVEREVQRTAPETITLDEVTRTRLASRRERDRASVSPKSEEAARLAGDEPVEVGQRNAPRRNVQEERAEFVAPDAVRKRFIQADNRYYFRHEDNKLAFEDHGHKMATAHDDPVVALSMVQMAEAKGWQSINLRGTQEFKREAWLQASLKGMDVRGYKPREVDVQKLAELQKELGTTPLTRNTVERIPERTPRDAAVFGRAAEVSSADPPDRAAVVDEPQRSLTPQQRVVLETVKAVWRHQGSSEREVELAASATVERFQNQRVYVGKVVERGEAPYELDPKNEKSFYVKLETPKGEKVVWGVDLRRALEEGGIEIGHEVVIANQGRKQVPVTVKDRDEAGTVLKTSTMVAHRNTWRIETLESLREEALESIRVKAAQADRAPLVPVHDRDAPRSHTRPEIHIERARDRERSL